MPGKCRPGKHQGCFNSNRTAVCPRNIIKIKEPPQAFPYSLLPPKCTDAWQIFPLKNNFNQPNN
jgi:hypothetical protein